MAAPAVSVGADAPILEVMATMRAMRRLKPDPVPDELLDELVEAATWAPSGGNLQAYSFVVVTDRGQMARLAELWRVICDWYLATLATGETVTHTLDDGRFGWLQVLRGEVRVADHQLTAGDGAAVNDTSQLEVTAAAPAEFMWFDLA